MNVQKIQQQLVTLWDGLATPQKAFLGIVLAMLVLGFTYIGFNNSPSGKVPISAGKAFTVEETMHAEQILLGAGLDDFASRGGQILVPRGAEERYNAALIAGGGLPQNWAEEWEAQMKDLGQFAGSRQRSDVVEIARAKMISSYLGQLPDVAAANVMWDEDKQPGFRSASKTKATVFLRAKPGRTIEPKTIAAVRMAVANSKKHLASADVVVMDITAQKAYDGTGNGDFADATMMRIHHLTEMYESRVANSLSYIPGVVVTANVNLEKLRESLVRKQQINPKEAFTVVGNTTKNSDSMQKVAVAAEPGGGPNVQLDLRNGRGPTQTRDVSESSEQTRQTASFEITESSLAGGMADSVTVSVSIPKTYYRTVAMTEPAIRDNPEATAEEIDTVATAVEQRVITQVSEKVTQILPPAPANDPNFRSVVVDSITVPETEEMEISIPFTVTAAQALKDYGRPTALAVLALVVLFILNKSLSRPMPELPELKLPPPPPSEEELEENREEELPDPFSPPQNRKREHLQTVMRDSPELGAGVISDWLASAK